MDIKITKEKVGYSAYIPDFRITTQGENFEDLLKNIKESILGYQESLNIKKTSSLDIVNMKHNLLSLKKFSLII